MSQSEHSNVVVIKYLHVLVQELAVRIDHGLINSALDLFSAETAIVPYTVLTSQTSIKLTRRISARGIRKRCGADAH